MPKPFEDCRKAGGRIRTESGTEDGLKANQYRHVCYLKGKRYPGHIKTKSKKNAARAAESKMKEIGM
ncbi:MAG: hypothetical protein QGH74_08340 [Candidatus Brocadiia bacterium]|nr:hypothetical protein [Candidatus Brocadiia bacterium]